MESFPQMEGGAPTKLVRGVESRDGPGEKAGRWNDVTGCWGETGDPLIDASSCAFP